MSNEQFFRQKPSYELENQVRKFGIQNGVIPIPKEVGHRAFSMTERSLKAQYPAEYSQYVATLRQLRAEETSMMLDRITSPLSQDFIQEATSNTPQMPEVTTRLESPVALARYIINVDFSDLVHGISYDELDDLIQEAIIQIHNADKRLSDFQEQGKWAHADDDRKSEIGYLAASARYAILNRIRYHRKRPANSLEEMREAQGFQRSLPINIEEEVINRLSRQEEQQQLQEARASLTEHQRRVLEAVEKGQDYTNIGQSLGISASAVSDALRGAVIRMREANGIDVNLPIQLFKPRRTMERPNNPLGKTGQSGKKERKRKYYKEQYYADPKKRQAVQDRMREYMRRKRETAKSRD